MCGSDRVASGCVSTSTAPEPLNAPKPLAVVANGGGGGCSRYGNLRWLLWRFWCGDVVALVVVVDLRRHNDIQ